MDAEALGSLHPIAPLATRILTGIEKKVDELYHEAFIDFLLKRNIQRLSWSREAKKWITALRQAITITSPPSTQASPAGAVFICMRFLLLSPALSSSSGNQYVQHQSNLTAKPKVDIYQNLKVSLIHLQSGI